jgi:ABC-type Na+ efflux pump permease subunit
MNPGMKEQMATTYRADLEAKGNYTVAEINTMVQKAKDYFAIMLTSMAIFGYLIIGSMVTLLTTLFFLKKKDA